MNYKKAGLILAILVGIWALKAGLGHVSPVPPTAIKAKNKWAMGSILNSSPIFRINTGPEKVIALTFDDGPDEKFTPVVLNILDKYNIKATFFVTGQAVEAHPDLVKKAVDKGHEIENHTYSHPEFDQISIGKVNQEIIRGGSIIENIAGKRPQYFRPPKGYYKADILYLAAIHRYSVVLWTICVENSSCPTANSMAQRIIDAAEPGIIILAHDGRLDRSRTMDALPLIIEGYQKKGYRFVTVDELMVSRIL
jgi:peptidoglycan/xylan/chitin deacetylase (PgdA/CDA1 family)